MERMAQKKMRKYRFTDNLGLKIIALIFSAFLWLIVVNVDNPVGSRTFQDIPVTIINDDIILSSGEVYQVYHCDRRRITDGYNDKSDPDQRDDPGI